MVIGHFQLLDHDCGTAFHPTYDSVTLWPYPSAVPPGVKFVWFTVTPAPSDFLFVVCYANVLITFSLQTNSTSPCAWIAGCRATSSATSFGASDASIHSGSFRYYYIIWPLVLSDPLANAWYQLLHCCMLQQYRRTLTVTCSWKLSTMSPVSSWKKSLEMSGMINQFRFSSSSSERSCGASVMQNANESG